MATLTISSCTKTRSIVASGVSMETSHCALQDSAETIDASLVLESRPIAKVVRLAKIGHFEGGTAGIPNRDSAVSCSLKSLA